MIRALILGLTAWVGMFAINDWGLITLLALTLSIAIILPQEHLR